MEFIESERGNQKLNIKLKKICGGQLSCFHFIGIAWFLSMPGTKTHIMNTFQFDLCVYIHV
jgi:hypothetical protein